MREYLARGKDELQAVVCNCCGRRMRVDGGVLKEDCVSVDHVFGYFSSRDGMRHHFDLCEACYQKIIASFALPVEEKEEAELL